MKVLVRCYCVLFCTTALALCTAGTWAATITVDLDGSADYGDIQSAIDAATDGDAVLVKPGEYVIAEPITFRGKPIINHNNHGGGVYCLRGSIYSKAAGAC